MKKEVVVNGRTVEEAVAMGAQALGVSADRVTHTVLEEPKKGFLGMGGTSARVSVCYVLPPEDAALNFVETLLTDMELDAAVTKKDGHDGEVLLDIKGETAGILIGHHGDTLDALQYLCNLAANRKDEEDRAYTKVAVDIESYRAKREETLRALARRTASKVQKYRRSMTLEPMNPYERRIIHAEVQDIDGVTTFSVGQDSARRVVVALADAEGHPISTGERTERPAARRDDTRRDNTRRKSPVAAPAVRTGNPVGYHAPKPANKPQKEKSVASYFGDEEYTDDYGLDAQGEPLDIAKICGIYDDDVSGSSEDSHDLFNAGRNLYGTDNAATEADDTVSEADDVASEADLDSTD